MSARDVVTHALNVYYADSRDTKKVVSNLLAMLRSETNAELIAEVASLRSHAAELEVERHSTNEALSTAMERLAELEALKPAPIQTCRTCGAGYTYGHPCSTCEFHRLMDEARAEVQRQKEDPHDSPLHHDYVVPHDLPPYTPNVRGDR